MKRIITIALMLVPMLMYAQTKPGTSRIYGQVKTDQGPAEYVTVRLLAAKDSSFVKGMTSDGAGNFDFAALPYDSYLLSVSSIGFKPVSSSRVNTTAEAPEIQVKDLMLVADSKTLKEVAVVSTVPFIETKSDMTVLNVENSVVSTGSTALEVLQKAPGVILDKDENISLKGKSGVVVMIDGKPSHLSAGDLAAMLRNMSANEISQMEIISNPSAKYDAAGNSGIINIKTKKLKNQGLNGTITAGTGYAEKSLYNGGVNLNYRAGKFNFFGNYNYSHNNRSANLGIDRYVTSNQTTMLFSQNGDKDREGDNNTIKAGADYFINDKNTVSLMMSGFINKGNGSLYNTTRMLDKDFRLDSSLTASQLDKYNFKNGAVNLNYRTVLDTNGQELTFDADYARFDKSQSENLNNNYYTGDGQPLHPVSLNRSQAPTTIDIRALKMDYVYPISKSLKLEAGIKTSFVKTDNDYRFENAQGGLWVSDPSKTNYFKYDENVNAAYVSMSRSFNRTTVQAGLRAELTRSEGNSVTTGLVVDTTYTRLFPSVFISQKLSEKHSLGFNFSQRIDRPGYEDLNPFIFMLDEYTYHQGNPYLSPQFTDSYGITYNYGGMLALAAGYSQTRDVMTFLTEQDDATKTTLATRRNLDKQSSYYLNANATFPVTRWWSSSNNINGFYLGFEDSDLDAGKVAVQVNTTQNFSLPKGIRLEIAGKYQSPLTYGIFDLEQQYQVDAGIQKSLFNKRGNLKLSMTNIFDSEKNVFNTTYRNMNFKFTERVHSRQGRLTFSYRFGNSQNKSSQRKTGVEEETSRTKKEN